MSATQTVTQPNSQTVGPFVVINEDGRWEGSIIYHRRRTLRPGVGEYIDGAGRVCEIPDDRMKLIAFMADEPTEEEVVQHQERRRYQKRSRTTATQRAKKVATPAQIKYIHQLRRALGYSQVTVLKMVPRPVQELCDLMLWEASKLIDRLKEA